MELAEYQEVDWTFADKDWIGEELQSALDALPTNKHRTTVLRLAEGLAVNRSMEATFKLKDVCAKKTWHGPYDSGVQKPGWKDDPLVQRALNLAKARVSSVQEVSIVANIKEAKRLLATEAPNAVMVLSTLMDDADSDDVKRKAANDLLTWLEKLLGVQGARMIMTESRTITFDLSKVPMEKLYDIVDS